MTSSTTTSRNRRLWPLVIAMLLCCAVLVLPTATTGAFWTSNHPAPATTAGVGRWCSVPNHELKPNVYRLTDFANAPYSGQTTTRMLAVPVVRNSDYAPTAPVLNASGQPVAAGTVGVRLWSCNSAGLGGTSAPSFKVTSWRKSTATADNQPLTWNAAATSSLSPQFAATLPAQRLSLTTGWGLRLQQLHRLGGNTSGTTISGDVRRQYSWVLGEGRTKTNPTVDPTCSTSTCTINMGSAPSWPNAFQADTATIRDYTNSVTYLGEKYWTGEGNWNWSFLNPPSTSLLQLTSYNPTRDQIAANTNGQQVQWVVMEWWGTAPSAYSDLVVEVFVA